MRPTGGKEFEAGDVAGAVAAAARELGIESSQVRYEVLDEGAKGFLGVGGRPARIRVSGLEVEGYAETGTEMQVGGSLEEDIRDFQLRMIRLMELDLDVVVESEAEHVAVRMDGRDRDWLLQDRAELLETFQYLLNRVFARRLGGLRILADSGGFRRRKEEELKEIARRASQKAKLTGLEQQLGMLNPYERRIVHLAVAAEEGVSSLSEGDGFLKRITIVPDK